MRRSETRQRGAPLIMLVTLISAWSLYRIGAWDPPYFQPPLVLAENAANTYTSPDRGVLAEGKLRLTNPEGLRKCNEGHRSWRGFEALDVEGRIFRNDGNEVSLQSASATLFAPALGTNSQSADPEFVDGEDRGRSNPPGNRGANPGSSFVDDGFAGSNSYGQSRWSADAWALLRGGSDAAFTSPQPSYGRSQIGAVIRYDLAPASTFRPQAYLRATSALAGRREREIASGVSIRPIEAIPVRLQIEGRLLEASSGMQGRAAILAISELPQIRLPPRYAAESYVQVGYVSGEFATAFVDGQVRVTRQLLGAAGADINVGAGAWGGAQESASRLDLGPTLSASLPIGRVRANVTVDYRFRVAGEAEPASGPALTLSAGF